MKKITLVLLATIIASSGALFINKHYGLTNYNIPLFSAPSGKVRIDFVNKSDDIIQSISLFPSSEKIENIQVGERRSVTFKQSGEGTYQFTVYFADGHELKEGERYVESGYFTTETIYKHKVKTKY